MKKTKRECENGLCSGCMSPKWMYCKDAYPSCPSFLADCPNNCPDPSQAHTLWCRACRNTCNSCTHSDLNCLVSLPSFSLLFVNNTKQAVISIPYLLQAIQVVLLLFPLRVSLLPILQPLPAPLPPNKQIPLPFHLSLPLYRLLRGCPLS